jgi:hypothetical protein
VKIPIGRLLTGILFFWTRQPAAFAENGTLGQLYYSEGQTETLCRGRASDLRALDINEKQLQNRQLLRGQEILDSDAFGCLPMFAYVRSNQANPHLSCILCLYVSRQVA